VRGRAVVATVAGRPLDPRERAWVDGHAHAWIAPPDGVASDVALRLDDEGAQCDALAAFARAAGERRAALIDCQPPGTGRDARRLAALSAASGVAIACVTGFHLARYYPGARRPWRDADEAVRAFVGELDDALAELPGRRAAAVKGAHTGVIRADRPWWEAVAEAHVRTGACVLVHTERGAGAIDLVGWLEDRGVAPSRIYLCHVDKLPDLGLHRELAEGGVLLGYDTFVRPAYAPDERVWPLLRAMVAAGLARSVAIGLDLAVAAMWRAADAETDTGAPGDGPPAGGAGVGPVALLDTIHPRLADAFADEAVVSALLGGNVLTRLARHEGATP
jgi:5-phospho-D-xylono-1,4-lactonase